MVLPLRTLWIFPLIALKVMLKNDGLYKYNILTLMDRAYRLARHSEIHSEIFHPPNKVGLAHVDPSKWKSVKDMYPFIKTFQRIIVTILYITIEVNFLCKHEGFNYIICKMLRIEN